MTLPVSRNIFWLVSFIIILCGIVFAIWFGAEGWSKTVYFAAPIIGSLLVATGWIVTSLNTITNNEREHTLRVLSDYHRDNEIKSRWNTIYHYLDNSIILKPPGKEADYPSDHEIYDAAFEQLNACEYIAVGAMKGV